MGLGGPDEGLGILVRVNDVALNGADQFGYTGKDAAAQALSDQVPEETLDPVQPRCGCRGKMDMEARRFLQPLLDLGVLVRGVVVADQMQRFLLGRFSVDLAQKLRTHHQQQP